MTVLRDQVAATETAAQGTAAREHSTSLESGPRPQAPLEPAPGDSGTPIGSVVGASSLIAVGLAGVIGGVVGIAGGGECLSQVGDACVEERSTAWGAVGAYGGLGLTAIGGGVVWLILALSDDEEAPAAADLAPRWRF